MRFENTFDVLGEPDDVVEIFGNLPVVAGFVPGASVGAVDDKGSCPGSLAVSFGPKRIVFTGLVSGHADTENLKGVIRGTANADIRGAKMAVTLNYSLAKVEGAASPTTRVNFVSDAQLTGVLAEFAKTGGVAVTNAILAEFARRLGAHLAAPAGQQEAGSATSSASNDALSFSLIVSEMLRSGVRRVQARLLDLVSRIRSLLFK